MEITLSTVVEAARQRRAALTAEAGGYIVLLVLQRLATGGPCQVTPEQILLTANGEIVIGASLPADPFEAERGLRRLLGSLLSLSQSAPPALKAAGERVSAGSLGALEAELMAALIPINHAASGRALARLFRETQRATRGAGTEPGDAEHGSPVPSSVTSSASETPRTPLTTSAPPSSIRSAPPPGIASAPPVSAPPGSVRSAPPPGIASAPPVSAPPSSVASAPPAVRTPVPPLLLVSAPPVAPLSAPPRAAEPVAAQAELEIDVEIVLAESSEGPAEVAVSYEELDVAVEELDVAAEDLDALLAEEASPTAPCAAASELSPFPGLAREDDPFAETPVPDSSPQAADTAWDPEPPPQRSDLRELLNGYLAHTRCAEHMTADLRRRIGLEPWRAFGSADVRN